MRVIDRPDVVISGLSGRFPSADNLEQFRDNLFNSVDMVTADSSRWPLGKTILCNITFTLAVDTFLNVVVKATWRGHLKS